MKTWLVAYGVTAATFLLIDSIWLSTMIGTIYRPVLGDALAESIRFIPALAFYLIFVFGLVFFAISPALSAGAWSTALINGALLGFVAYATYDLTNHATLKNWSTFLTVADMAWGTVLSGAAATGGYFLTNLIVRQ
jgi:uncharacterized membrane protein